MHILVMPSWYPTKHPFDPVPGAFFREQAHALLKAGEKVGLIYPEFRAGKPYRLKALRENHFQIEAMNDNALPTVRTFGWSIPWLIAFFKYHPLFIYQSMRLFSYYKNRFGTPDLLHAHSIFWAGVASQKISQKYKIPYVITEHSSAFTFQKINPWQLPHMRTST